MTDCHCLQDIHQACINAKQIHDGRKNNAPFGGMHYVAFGDLAQHAPINGTPLWDTLVEKATRNAKRAKTVPSDDKDKQGRDLWLLFDKCIILEESFRFENSPDGIRLRELVQQLSTGFKDAEWKDPVDYEELADVLNSTVIVKREEMKLFLQSAPKALVLRHEVRAATLKQLVLHHAAKHKTRVTCWRNVDMAADPDKEGVKSSFGKTPSDDVVRFLETHSCNELPSSIQYFYVGIPYRFIKTRYQRAGWFTNGNCFGQQLILDDREPEDDEKNAFRVLKYPPKCIVVKVPGLGDFCGSGFPTDCIPVVPEPFSKTITFGGGRHLRLFTTGQKKAPSIRIRRHGFAADCVITFTDFYAQGVSFKGEPHFLHLGLRKDEKHGYKRGNLLVPLSRASKFSEIHLLQPLWQPGDTTARQKIINKLRIALTMKPAAAEELRRMHSVHDITFAAFVH